MSAEEVLLELFHRNGGLGEGDGEGEGLVVARFLIGLFGSGCVHLNAALGRQDGLAGTVVLQIELGVLDLAVDLQLEGVEIDLGMARLGGDVRSRRGSERSPRCPECLRC